MKYVILIGDGMADYPLPQLGGRTPLSAARTSNMDFIAAHGTVGWAQTIPPKFAPASDVANLSILGYDPNMYYTGRGPLEAANMGIKLKGDETAFRCNLITAEGDSLVDYSAGHITTKEARVLIDYIGRSLGTDKIRFYPGVSYRHLMLIEGDYDDVKCIPPHDITGEEISKHLPRGRAAEILVKLIERSRELLSKHDINKVRVDLGENPANMIWLWGQGKNPNMPAFKEKYGIEGAVISAVDLIKGIGRTIGFRVIDVPGATAYYDTNYKGKAEYALSALEDCDLVYVHVEAPDEAGHNGDVRAKVKVIERFDEEVVGTVLNYLTTRVVFAPSGHPDPERSEGEGSHQKGDFRILVMPDHYTPITVRTHTAEPVPFAIFGKGVAKGSVAKFDEESMRPAPLKFDNGYELMGYFLK